MCPSQVTPPPPPPLDCQPTPVVGREGQLEAESCGLGMRLISISKGHCSEEVGELHRQLEQARKESSVAPRDRGGGETRGTLVGRGKDDTAWCN